MPYIVCDLTGDMVWTDKPLDSKTKARNELIKLRDNIECCLADNTPMYSNKILDRLEKIIAILGNT